MASERVPRSLLRTSGSMSLTRNALVFIDIKSSNADMNRLIPSLDGTVTFVWTIRASPSMHDCKNWLRLMMSMSPKRISFLASLINNEFSIVRCRFKRASAFCWNCWGLISSDPTRLGMIIERPATSLNRFANICVLRIYRSMTSMWLFERNAS